MNRNYWLLFGFTALIFYFTPQIPQDENYHNFADTRYIIVFENSWDVLSNLPFIIFGLMGMVQTSKTSMCNDLRFYLNTFFIGAIMVGIGSGYYHLEPNSETLVWDRLPMTISFMSLVCVIMHILDMKEEAKKFFPILIPVGVLSVFYWAMTNDLRPYILVQFVPMIWIPIKLYKSSSIYRSYLWNMLIFYILAKVFETADKWIFSLSGETISGHSLKHLSASISILIIAQMTKKLKGL